MAIMRSQIISGSIITDNCLGAAIGREARTASGLHIGIDAEIMAAASHIGEILSRYLALLSPAHHLIDRPVVCPVARNRPLFQRHVNAHGENHGATAMNIEAICRDEVAARPRRRGHQNSKRAGRGVIEGAAC